ncbi:hypothetical protein [Noviherbaspirillum massiliense]|uniref:hypothetical protein n=1 Tax=Noviherbaspirillum massiliense TaxID=1465823 RepID=UPI001588083D|nr:hypothetical protein [Noviherbaspirillum massiliense]
MIVSLAASDWAECTDSSGKLDAAGRLMLLRDLFFADEFSLGNSRIPVTRQSTTPKFRSYTENARWEVRRTMFATINLPQDNNHYVMAAGRNSEFEDRQVANRHWLQRVFIQAIRKKFSAVILFCDGNPFARPRDAQRDGFLEIRQQITAWAARFPGKVLLIHNPGAVQSEGAPRIRWRDNLGELKVTSGWMILTVDPSLAASITVEQGTAAGKDPHS